MLNDLKIYLGNTSSGYTEHIWSALSNTFATTDFKVNKSIAGISCLNFSYLFMDPNLSLEKQSSNVWCHKDKLELRKLENGGLVVVVLFVVVEMCQ